MGCWILLAIAGTALNISLTRTAEAETIKIGVLKGSAAGPLFIAKDKGYFSEEGLAAEFVFLDQPQAFLAGVISGDLDLSQSSLNAAFYNVAGQGALHTIAGFVDEAPTFHSEVLVASQPAYAAGLKTIRDIPDHSFAITAAGTPGEYLLGLLAEKYRFDFGTVKILQTGTFPNLVSAVVGANADSAIIPMNFVDPPMERDEVHRLAWLSDEVRMQIGTTIASAKTTDTRHEMIERFLRAYRRGARDYHDAFTGPGEIRQDGPTAPAVYAIIEKYLNQPLAAVRLGIGHVDADLRVDVMDMLHQIRWYKSHGLLKQDVDGNAIIDKRYVEPMP